MEAEMEGCADGEEKVPCRSFTTLSTVAVQAGRSQLVVSVLKSGSVIHVNLAEVSPGLSEIGSDQEENQTLVQEHQQLLIKLKKQEFAVMALLSQADQTAEEEEGKASGHGCGVYQAMADSLREGWSLLLLLLEKRQLLLQEAAGFYLKAQQFALSLDRAEEFQDDLEACKFTRRGLLERSLQVLTGMSALLHKLRELQNTDVLQRTRAVLHLKDSSAQILSAGRLSELRVEKMVEELQDRRRRLEQNIKEKEEQNFTDLNITDLNIKEQNITDSTLKEQQNIQQNIIEKMEQNIIGENVTQQHNITEQHTDMANRITLHQNYHEPVQKIQQQVYHNHQRVQQNQHQQVRQNQQQVLQTFQKNQECFDRNHWSMFDTLLQKVLQDLVSVEEILVVSSKVELGCDHDIVSRLLHNFQQAKPHFTCLDLQVDQVFRMWASLSQDRLPVKEKEAELQHTQNLHQRIRGQIHRCYRVLSLADSFHQTANQVKGLIRRGGEGCGVRSCLQEQQVQKLYRSSLSLVHNLCTLVKGSPGFSVSRLIEVLVDLEEEVSVWLRQRHRHQDNLHTDQLLLELREGFQGVQKCFNIEKMCFLKRKEHDNWSSHSSALSTQLMQVELYRDQLQALQGRLSDLTSQLDSEIREGCITKAREDAVNQLQRQMSESQQSIDDHLFTLHTTHSLLLCMEEYGLWCGDIQELVLRVRGSISQCCSVQALSALSSQFNSCVCPTVVGQEHSIQQMTDMAVKLHGAAEGKRLMETTVGKHSDIKASIRDLQQKIHSERQRLQVKGQVERIEVEKWREWSEKEGQIAEKERKKKTQPKESSHTPELTREHDGKEVPIDWQKAANQKPLLNGQNDEEDVEGKTPDLSCFKARESPSSSREGCHSSWYSYSQTFSLSCSPLVPQRRVLTILSQSQPSSELKAPPSPHVGMWQGMQAGSDDFNKTRQDHQDQEVMSEESLFNDDYECMSPDDISLPPLSETPESNLVLSDRDDIACCSSRSTQYNQYSSQSSHHDNNQYHMETEAGTGLVLDMKSCPTGDTALQCRESTLEMKGTPSADQSQPQDSGSSLGCSQHSPPTDSRILQHNKEPRQHLGLFQIPCDHNGTRSCSCGSQDHTVHSTTFPHSTTLESKVRISHDTPVCHERPLFKSSVSAVADEQLISSSPLPQQALDDPTSLAEALSQPPLQAPELLHMPTSDQSDQSDVYRHLSVRGAISLIQVISESHAAQDSFDTQYSHYTHCSNETHESEHTQDGCDTDGSFDIRDKIETQDRMSICRSSRSTATEVYSSTEGLQPYSVLSHHHDDTQYSHNTKESQDTQYNHDSSQGHVTQVCHGSPATFYQSSKPAVSQHMISNSSLPHQALDEPSTSCADTLSQPPLQASEPLHLPTPDHQLDVYRHLSVREAIGLIPVISESHDTHICHNTPVCPDTQYRVDPQGIFDSHKTQDRIETQDRRTMCRSSKSTTSESTEGLQPCTVLSQLPEEAQVSHDTQVSYENQVCHDYQKRNDIQNSSETHDSIGNQGSNDTQGSHDPQDSYDSPACHATQYSNDTQNSSEASIDNQGSNDTQDWRSMCRSSRSTASEVSWSTEGLQPCSILSHCPDDTQCSDDTQFYHDTRGSQDSFDNQNSHETQDIQDTKATQYTQGNQDTQCRHDRKGNFDTHRSHDAMTKGHFDSQQSIETQNSCDTKGCHESPITLFQSSVSDLSEQIISSSSLLQQAIDDVLFQLPLQPLKPPHLRTPEQVPDVCQPLSDPSCVSPGICESHKTQVCCDSEDSHDNPVYQKTQYSNGSQCSYDTQSIFLSHDTKDSLETQDRIRMCWSSRCTATEVSWPTEGLEPCNVLPHHHDDSQGGYYTQHSHDTEVYPDTQGEQDGLDNQASHDSQEFLESPVSIFQSSVSGVSQQMISRNPLEHSFLADTLSQHPLQAPEPPHLPTPDEDPDVCLPLSVREAICLIPVIQGPPLPHPQPPSERLPQGKSSKAGFPCVSRHLSRASLMENSELTLELEVSGGVPETTLTWLTEGQLPSSEDNNPSGRNPADTLQATHFNHSIEKWLVGEVYDIISLDWNTWFGTLCVLLWLLYLVLL